MASEPRNYPDYVFVAYDEDFSAQTYDIAVSLEPGNLVGRPVKYIRHDLNTRPAPAATDTGLVTVAWQRNIGGSDVENWVSHFILDLDAALGCPVRELVTRSQAVELLADLHAAIAVKDHGLKLLQADNAAQAARVKELEQKFTARTRTAQTYRDFAYQQRRKAEALEAKLTAAEKALEPFANAADGRKSKSVTGSVCFSQHYLLAARAARRGKPS